jgi:amino acid permease
MMTNKYKRYSSICFFLSFNLEQSHRLIVETHKYHEFLKRQKISSYGELISYPFGRIGESFLMLGIFVTSFGAMLEDAIVVKDTLPLVLGYGLDNTRERKTIVFLVWCFILVPLTTLKDLSTLEHTSMVTFVVSLLLAVLIYVEAPIIENLQANGGLGDVMKEHWFNPNIFATMNIFSEAIVWQHGAFLVFGTFRKANCRRWFCVTSCVNLSACILYAMVGIPGYVGFLDKTRGNILNNFPVDSFRTNVARSLFSMVVIFTYPLEAMIAREVVMRVIHRSDKEFDTGTNAESDNKESINDTQSFLRKDHLFVSLVLNVLVLIRCLVSTNLGKVLYLVGGIGGNILIFIAPGLIYLGVHGGEFILHSNRLLGCESAQHATTNFYAFEGTSDGISSGRQQLLLEHVPLSPMKKPLWWFLLGFPLWTRIASYGHSHLIQKIIANSPDSTWSFLAADDDLSGYNLSSLSSSMACDGHELFSIPDSEEIIEPPSASTFRTAQILIVLGTVNFFASFIATPT